VARPGLGTNDEYGDPKRLSGAVARLVPEAEVQRVQVEGVSYGSSVPARSSVANSAFNLSECRPNCITHPAGANCR